MVLSISHISFTWIINYCTSPRLFLDLYRKKVNAYGTARTNRKYYPKQLAVKANELAKGFYDYRSSGPLLACVWKDKRIINFLSTIHIAEADVMVPRVQIPAYHAYLPTNRPAL